jgi:polysaccharide pyruvyl transferase WcaK-like protein
MLTIALIFHSARNANLGVGALTVSEVEIIRRIAKARDIAVHIDVIDSIEAGPICVSGPDVAVRETRILRRPLEVFGIIRKADLVIDIGAGDSFADIYGRGRLIRLFMMKYMAHLAGRPLVLAPQTFGPFVKPLSRFFALQSIKRAAIVATRDQLSTDCARELGYRGRVIEASDVALRLPYSLPAARSGPGPVRVGLNVSDLLMAGGYTGRNMFGLQMDYPALMRDVITRFQAHPDGCEVHLVPHVIRRQSADSGQGGVEDDYSASLALAREFPGVIVAPAFATPSEAKSYIAGLDFFAGARMHACIAAFSSGVPVVPMAYSRKFAGLFGSLGYDRTVDCTTESAATIVTQIFAAYDDRAKLAKDVRQALDHGLEKLGAYETALGDLMGRLAAR